MYNHWLVQVLFCNNNGCQINEWMNEINSQSLLKWTPTNSCCKICIQKRCKPVNWIVGHIHPQCNEMACFHHDLERVSPTMNGNMMCEHTPCSPPTGTRNFHKTPVESHVLPATYGQHFVLLVMKSIWPTMCEKNNCTYKTVITNAILVTVTLHSSALVTSQHKNVANTMPANFNRS